MTKLFPFFTPRISFLVFIVSRGTKLPVCLFEGGGGIEEVTSTLELPPNLMWPTPVVWSPLGSRCRIFDGGPRGLHCLYGVLPSFLFLLIGFMSAPDRDSMFFRTLFPSRPQNVLSFASFCSCMPPFSADGAAVDALSSFLLPFRLNLVSWFLLASLIGFPVFGFYDPFFW